MKKREKTIPEAGVDGIHSNLILRHSYNQYTIKTSRIYSTMSKKSWPIQYSNWIMKWVKISWKYSSVVLYLVCLIRGGYTISLNGVSISNLSGAKILIGCARRILVDPKTGLRIRFSVFWSCTSKEGGLLKFHWMNILDNFYFKSLLFHLHTFGVDVALTS